MFATLIVFLTLVPATTPVYDPEAASFSFSVIREKWHGQRRDRDVPIKLYVPQREGPMPTVLLSHGLGGTNDGSTFIAEHLAGRGFCVIAMQHPGSDDAVWRGVPAAQVRARMNDAMNATRYRARLEDVDFILRKILSDDQPKSVAGRIDGDRIAMMGHSFGAVTAQAVIGINRAADTRIKAAVLLSPSPPRMETDDSYANVRVPVLHLTGTRDEAPIGGTTAAQRREPFDHIDAAGQILVVLGDGDHGIFSGQRIMRPTPRVEKQRAIIQATTTAFLEANLCGQTAAADWLAEHAKLRLGDDATFESK